MKSIYIHIPFCKSKCSYCDFNSYSNKEALIDRYISALLEEMDKYFEDTNSTMTCPETIYFGGGTPSYINDKYIKMIMENITRRTTFDKINGRG